MSAEATPCRDSGVEVEELLPLVPKEVVFHFVLPHAYDSFGQALELMLLCRAAYEHATTTRAFWEPFLWRRLRTFVIPALQAAYTKYAGPLVDLLQQKYIMWPDELSRDGEVMTVVRSKRFVVEQLVRPGDRWGALNPTCCSQCHDVKATPWWRCVECPEHTVVCVSCRGQGRSVIRQLSCSNFFDDEDDDDEDDDDEDEDDEDDDEDEGGDVEGNGGTENEGGREGEDAANHDGDDDKVVEEEVVVEQANPAAPAATDEVVQNEEEEKEESKSNHKDEHAMQLVVDKQPCLVCCEAESTWYCQTCLDRGCFVGLCDPCRTEVDEKGTTSLSYKHYQTVKHDSSSHVMMARRGEAAVDEISRWTVEEPHPKLTFAEAWADRKSYTALFCLKLYAPTFTGHGCYTCFFEDRPSLVEGFIRDGGIASGIKYTGWKHPADQHIYKGMFDGEEAFPLGMGSKEWRSGVRFEGMILLHQLLGHPAKFTFPNGVRWEGELDKDGMFDSSGLGSLTLPGQANPTPCHLKTGQGRHSQNLHLWTEDGSAKYVLSLVTGCLTPVDEFVADDEDDESSDDSALSSASSDDEEGNA